MGRPTLRSQNWHPTRVPYHRSIGTRLTGAGAGAGIYPSEPIFTGVIVTGTADISTLKAATSTVTTESVGTLNAGAVSVSGQCSAGTFYSNGSSYSQIDRLSGKYANYEAVYGYKATVVTDPTGGTTGSGTITAPHLVATTDISTVDISTTGTFTLHGVPFGTKYFDYVNNSITGMSAGTRVLVMSFAVPSQGQYLAYADLCFTAISNLSLWNCTVEMGVYSYDGTTYTKVTSLFSRIGSYGGVASTSVVRLFSINASNLYIHCYVTPSATCTLNGRSGNDYYTMMHAIFNN